MGDNNVGHVQNMMQQFVGSCSICKQLTEKIAQYQQFGHYLIQSYNTQVTLIISFEQVYQRFIGNPIKHLRWSVLQQQSTAKNHYVFSQKATSQMFGRVLNCYFAFLFYTFCKSSFIAMPTSNIVSKSSFSGNISKLKVWQFGLVVSSYHLKLTTEENRNRRSHLFSTY